MRSPQPIGATSHSSEAASSKRLVGMAPGSARNWIVDKNKSGLKTMKTLHSVIASLRPTFLIIAQRIALPLLFLGTALVLAQPCAAAPFEFENTGSLADGRTR